MKELRNAFDMIGSEKVQALARVKEKMSRLSQSAFSRNSSFRSSRPPSATRDKQKEDLAKSKFAGSPYLQKSIPEKKTSFRLKHVKNPAKVPKSRSFALLDI